MPLVKHVATFGVVSDVGGRLNDFVIRKHILGFFGPLNHLPCHAGAGSIGTNDHAGAYSAQGAQTLFVDIIEVHHGHAIVVAGDFLKVGTATVSSMRAGTFSEPFIKLVAVHHAYKSIFNGDVDAVVFRGHHARATRFGHQQVVGDFKVFDEPRGYGATTGFGAALTV